MADEKGKVLATNTVNDEKPTSASLQGSDSRSGSDAAPVFDKAAERRLLWKLDLLILPILFLFYMMSYLDRANIGK